ncbi:MAG: lysozyme [Desulfobulbaceae bacterium]|nr:lysozyme [Desulfobulbaceae bacterium]
MNISKKGLSNIKHFEGLRLDSYHCSAGVLTIGYGHTGPDVTEDMVITIAQADSLLEKDVKTFVAGVNALLTTDISQNQFDALVSFAYNLGLGALGKSTLLKLVNRRKFTMAASEFLRWNKCHGHVLNGLTARREAERKLFAGY